MARHFPDRSRAQLKEEMGGRTVRNFTFRVTSDIAEFIKSEVDRISRENPGLSVGPSDVVRMALRRMMAERRTKVTP
jgi:hypothetical protein